MFYEPKISELNGIIEIFKNDNASEMNVWIDRGGLFINTKNGETEFMLRFDERQKTLIVARIMFMCKRKGSGTELLKELKKFGVKNGFESIVFESIMTEEVYHFLKKNKFTKLNSIFSGDSYIGDWKLDFEI